MKKRLLSFFAFALMALALHAQSWVAPTLKLTTDAVPEKAYIYNVEQGKFLTKGGAWGTHASIKADVSAAFLYEIQDQGEGAYVLHCSAAANTGKLGRNGIEDVYTDYKSGDWATTWEFVKAGDYYQIRTAASDPAWGANKYTEDETNYGVYVLGWNADRQDLTNGSGDPMGTNDGVYMVDPIEADGWSVDWAFMTEDDYTVYSAQTALYEALNKAAEIGYTEAELKKYADQLTSTDLDALAAATAEIDDLVINYAYNHATPENPYEVTAKIQNPTFDGARDSEPAGWVDEFSNMKIQNNKAYHIWDDDTNVETEEYGLDNFSQNWTSGSSITESNIYQVISDLPQGTYILQADAIATTGSADDPVAGCELYAESGAVHYAAAIDKNIYGADGSGLPRRYQVMVVHMGGDLKIGYGFKPGHVKWFAVDNMKLFYAGPVDNPGLVALAGTLEAAQPYLDYYTEEPSYYYSEATKDALADEVAKAESLTNGGSSEDCLAAATAINNILSTIKNEVVAYGKLDKFVAQVMFDVARYPFIEDLGDKYDDYKGAYEDKTATIEQIAEWTEGYAAYIQAGIKAALATATEEAPVEVTGLFANLGFEENVTESASPTSWTCDASAFKARANVGEVWNVTFDAYTTLTDLPAGAYRITAHGLSRSGDSVGNYSAEGADITAEFYANGASVKVKSQHLGASAEKLYTNDVDLTGIAAEEEHEALWAPNSMEGARVYFNVEDNPYVNTLTANLLNDGDPLRIGFRDQGVNGEVVGNSWTIWSDLRVYYIGVSSNALYEEMLNIKAKVAELLEAPDVEMVKKSSEKLNDAYNNAEATSSLDAEEKITAVIDEMTSAIAYYNEGKALVDKVMAAVEDVETITAEYEADGTELGKLYMEMEEAAAAEEFESNEQMKAWLEALPAARTSHVMTAIIAEADEAPSEENPVNVTDVMVNASFQSNNANGWTVSNTGGSVGGSEAQRTESTAYEIWNGTAFDINQTVVGLREGYYRLSVKALFRNGNNSDDLAAQYFAASDSINALAQFYANGKSVNVKSIFEDAQTEDPAIDGQATFVYNGTTYYTANTMISFEKYAMDKDLYNNVIDIYLDGKTDLTVGLRYESSAGYIWFPFDEFTISYMGTTEPSSVQGVETAAGVSAIYNLNGQLQSRLQKGVNIVRKADGSVLKLMVK